MNLPHARQDETNAGRASWWRRVFELFDGAFDLAPEERAETLVALDDALSRLVAIDKRAAQVIECRFFGGLSEGETAEALGITSRTVRRDWVKAKGWLVQALRD